MARRHESALQDIKDVINTLTVIRLDLEEKTMADRLVRNSCTEALADAYKVQDQLQWAARHHLR